MKRTKKVKALNLLCAALVLAAVGTAAVPVLAGDHQFDYKFCFDYGNTEATTTEFKDSRHAVTMTCTGSDNLSSYNYTAYVYNVNGGNTSGIILSVGKTAIFYSAADFKDNGVYIKGYLNGDDVDTFWGTWNPDDPRY